ncbi:hypothetical protein LEN26_005873 [Aphanomyces euteiches]|nr:hypothetical protein AeMF1_010980 [Aphanomyces euteiches]KAH9137215.1 hypothetical protein LEN26_005873 [Aphanomyces euteiches]KAH9187612.1 hypothetical protein AeNC1_010408 [Aphanomyces euteiches]
MGKKVFNPITPHIWTHEEHCRFLEALEKCGHCTPSSSVWSMIAEYVGTRNYKDVKLHANRYFLQLQMLNTHKRREMQAMQAIDSRWTLEDDKLFEDLLAKYSSCAYYPWEIIASKFINKSAKGVRDRYQKLLFDIALIENGQHVTMHMKSCNSQNDERELDGRHQNDSELSIYDTSVTLTEDEEDLILTALEEAQVPQTTPSNILAFIASAIVAITNHHNKKLPTRKTTAFTKEEAAKAIANTLVSPSTDSPIVVLDKLITALNLKDDPSFMPPPDPKHSTGSFVGSVPLDCRNDASMSYQARDAREHYM